MVHYLLGSSVRQFFSFKKLLIVLVFLFVLLAASSCGQLLSTGYVTGGDHLSGCSVTPITNSLSARDVLTLIFLVLSLSIFFYKRAIMLLSVVSDISRHRMCWYFESKVSNSHKLSNPILRAFRRGILHSQVYNRTF